MIEVLAPGKVVLLGEYAVVDGAPAIVAAVDRGVRCVASPAPTLAIDAPDDRFVGPALHDATGSYRFTSWNPPATPSKAGLGSSAAATVAAVTARRAIEDLPHDPAAAQAAATAIHRVVQGSGSGIDVAASCHGGVLRFTLTETHPIPAGDLADRLSVVWSGRSADTGRRVERYRALTDRRWFTDASAAVVDGWAADPIGAFAAASKLLQELDERAELGWWIPEYAPILARAADHGGAAKPSGAGGGDVVVAVFPDREHRDAFERACPADQPLGVRLAGPATPHSPDGA